jgi:hypothetical protein
VHRARASELDDGARDKVRHGTSNRFGVYQADIGRIKCRLARFRELCLDLQKLRPMHLRRPYRFLRRQEVVCPALHERAARLQMIGS